MSKTKKLRALSCLEFVERVLRLDLSPAWRVVLRVAIDKVQPCQLDPSDQEIARELFGDVSEVPTLAHRKLLFILGRGSGKTTIAAAIAIWRALTADLSFAGPGDIPIAGVVSIDRATASLFVRVARTLMERVDGVEILAESAQGFTFRRPDGRAVSFEVFAAARAGGSLRGRSLLLLVIDESWFMRSEDGGFTVTDADVIKGALPRLRGPLILMSTPWPAECETSKLFVSNHGHPTTALVAKGASMFMRPDDDELRAHIEAEREANPGEAAREFDCDTTQAGSGCFFDAIAVDKCVDDALPLVMPVPAQRLTLRGAPLDEPAHFGASMDVGFKSDSSALAVVRRWGRTLDKGLRLQLACVEEIRPAKGAPLKPSEVAKQFAETLYRYSITRVAADSFYIEAMREHMAGRSMRLVELPGGAGGKFDTYAHLRTVIHEGRFTMPRIPRLIAQLKSITSTALPGGGVKITAPRRSGNGGGHGDLVSALVGGAWAVNAARGPARGVVRNFAGV